MPDRYIVFSINTYIYIAFNNVTLPLPLHLLKKKFHQMQKHSWPNLNSLMHQHCVTNTRIFCGHPQTIDNKHDIGILVQKWNGAQGNGARGNGACGNGACVNGARYNEAHGIRHTSQTMSLCSTHLISWACASNSDLECTHLRPWVSQNELALRISGYAFLRSWARAPHLRPVDQKVRDAVGLCQRFAS